MGYSHEDQVGAQLAADLVNAGASDELEPLLRAHGIRSPHVDADTERHLRGWADDLRLAFSAHSDTDLCEQVNTLLGQAAGNMSLTVHDGSRPHLHLFPEGDDILSRVRAVTIGGLAFYIAWSGGTRMGTCSRTGCARVFIDNSKAGRQRFCSARCGNTDAVARHRAAKTPRQESVPDGKR